MRRKSKNLYLKVALVAYVLVAVGVIGVGWLTRGETDPYSQIPEPTSPYVRLTIPSDVDLGGVPSSDGLPSGAESLEMAVESNHDPASTEVESPDPLGLDDLRLSGNEPEARFEVVVPNPYLVTD